MSTTERFSFSLNKAQRAKVAEGKLDFSPDQVERLKTFAKQYMKHSTSIAGNGNRFTVSRTLHDGASKQLHDEAKALEFASAGRSYMECRDEIRRRRPELDWFLCGVPVPDAEADVTVSVLEDAE